MAIDKHKHDNQCNPTKRDKRIETNGMSGSKKHNPSSRQATVEVGETVIKDTHQAMEVDEIGAAKSLGIVEFVHRETGISIPDSPYQKHG